jgi:hypothetical protein
LFVQIAKTIAEHSLEREILPDEIQGRKSEEIKESSQKRSEHLDLGSLTDEIAAKVAALLALERTPLASKGTVARSKEQPLESSLIFVIMSFFPDMDPIFEGIEAAASSVGLEAKRVKDVRGDYRITEKIM